MIKLKNIVRKAYQRFTFDHAQDFILRLGHAEALGKHLAGDKFDFYSAGTETANQSGRCAAYEVALRDRYGTKPIQQDD